MLLTFFSLLNPLGTVTARQDNSAGYAHRLGSVTELSMAAGKCCTQGVFIIYLRKVKYSQTSSFPYNNWTKQNFNIRGFEVEVNKEQQLGLFCFTIFEISEILMFNILRFDCIINGYTCYKHLANIHLVYFSEL